MKYNYIVGIDPAGSGSTGIVIWDVNNDCIEFHETFTSENWKVAEFNIKKFFDKLAKIPNFKPLIIMEDFFLIKGRMITKPLETPKFIGVISGLVRFYYNWYLILQPTVCKNAFNYVGNVKLTEHEHDAWRHIQYFLKERTKWKKLR